MYSDAILKARQSAAEMPRSQNSSIASGQYLVDNRPVQRKANRTGLPDNLKTGIEHLSGYSMDDVKVHYNSAQPAQLSAHAFAQGNQIHIATGQEQHLPHEAWHVVQQKQGRVRPTFQMKKVNVNDDSGLEKEADLMGARALQLRSAATPSMGAASSPSGNTIQRQAWAWPGAIAGGIGAVGGGVIGAIKGGYKAIRAGQSVREGVLSGGRKGGREGYEDPLEVLGEVGGAASSVGGALKGAVRGVQSGHPVKAAALREQQQSLQTGYDSPGAAVGSMVGAVAGGLTGLAGSTIGAVGGALTGATLGLYQTGTLSGTLAGLVAGGVAGSYAPIAAGAALGSVLGSAVGEQVNKKINRKTGIKHAAGYITLQDFKPAQKTNHKVGKRMEARLFATDPVVGSATDDNWTWMQSLRNDFPASNIVRGHLLNHDLGGFGVPENLYPITTKANHEHSMNVEQPVKELLKQELTRKDGPPKPVFYSVQVNEDEQNNPQKATLDCRFYTEDEPVRKVNIRSVLGEKGGFGGKKDNPLKTTSWHHGQRKGFIQDPDPDSLVKYSQTHIKMKQEPADYEPNENVQHIEGISEAVKLMLQQLDSDCFSHFTRALRKKILQDLDTKAAYYFSESILKYFINSGLSKQKKNWTVDELRQECIKIVKIQLKILEGKYKHIKDLMEDIEDAWSYIKTLA